MRASHIKTFRGHGSFISSNLVDETHVPRNAPGTPQANARFRPARAHARSADESQESAGDCAQGAGSGRSRSEAGLGQKQGGLGGREALEGESSVGRGRSKGLGREPGRAWAESRVAGSERSRGPRQAKRTVGPPDGQAAHTGLCRFPGRTPGPPGEPTMRSGRPRRRRRNAGADPLGHRSFMESA
jgi:hypothetical protein